MSDEPPTTSPASVVHHGTPGARAHHATTADHHASHTRGFPASRPSTAFLPVRRWVLEHATELRGLRNDLREQLAASWPAYDDTPDNVVLVVSELATNALAHGRPPAHVQLLLDGDATLVVVSDADLSHLPVLAEGREPGEGGFGLQIARRLSEAVGWWSDASGKHVWAAFRSRTR